MYPPTRQSTRTCRPRSGRDHCTRPRTRANHTSRPSSPPRTRTARCGSCRAGRSRQGSQRVSRTHSPRSPRSTRTRRRSTFRGRSTAAQYRRPRDTAWCRSRLRPSPHRTHSGRARTARVPCSLTRNGLPRRTPRQTIPAGTCSRRRQACSGLAGSCSRPRRSTAAGPRRKSRRPSRVNRRSGRRRSGRAVRTSARMRAGHTPGPPIRRSNDSGRWRRSLRGRCNPKGTPAPSSRATAIPRRRRTRCCCGRRRGQSSRRCTLARCSRAQRRGGRTRTCR